jgi:hypothetical protein
VSMSSPDRLDLEAMATKGNVELSLRPTIIASKLSLW